MAHPYSSLCKNLMRFILYPLPHFSEERAEAHRDVVTFLRHRASSAQNHHDAQEGGVCSPIKQQVQELLRSG